MTKLAEVKALLPRELAPFCRLVHTLGPGWSCYWSFRLLTVLVRLLCKFEDVTAI